VVIVLRDQLIEAAENAKKTLRPRVKALTGFDPDDPARNLD
jgi:hypothetical protein